MKEQRNQKWQCHLWCILIAVLLSFSLLSFPVTALVPDTTGEDYEELTDPTLTEEFISSETIIGGETAELQADEIVTSSYLSDGVYAFRNIGNGNLWMDLERNNISSSAHIQQYYSETPPTESFSKAMLFKITRIGTTNRYVVRLMMNNLLTFDFDGTSVKTKRIPANDAEVDINDLICITYTASGYSLRPYDSSNYICANNTTASGLAGAPDSYLIASTLSVAGNCGRWEIHQYTGTARSGFSAGSSPNLNDGLTVGETSRVSVYAWSTTVGANHPSLEVTSAFSTRASVTAIDSATDFSTQFDVKALKAGRFEFCYRIKSASGTNVYSYYQMQMAIPDIDTGSFYIQNGTTGQYMDVEGPSTAEGAIIQQWTFSTATQKQWTIASAGSGYYTIKSNYSNKYVGVDSSDTTSVKQYSTVNDYTKWFFYETNSGRYSINNKALGVSYVLATPSDTSSTGINLTTAIYSNDTSYRDEWMLYSTTYRIVNYYDVSLINNTAYVQAIKQANEYVSSVLKSLFNVDLIMEGSAVYWQGAYSNKCLQQNNVCNSTCGNDCDIDHHKNLDVILADVKKYQTRNDAITIVWMDRPNNVYCIESSGQHQIYSAIAVGRIGEPFAEALSLSANIQTTSEYGKIISSILLHEVVHCFGFQDVYGTTGHQRNQSCVMDYYSEGAMKNYYDAYMINSTSPFCSSCITGIKAKINETEFWR